MTQGFDIPHARIERRFADLTDSEIELYASGSFEWLSYRSNDNWNKLLECPRVILICEAGTGKTFECKAQKQTLWDEGKPAFFLDLTELEKSGCVEDTLDPKELERFESWKTDQLSIATFFLDSIDELNLTRGIFKVAIKKFAKAVSGNLGRIHVVITSRPPVESELKIIKAHLQVPDMSNQPQDEAFANVAINQGRSAQKKDAPPDWRIVGLLPLTQEQIKVFVNNFGIENSQLFLDNILQFNALELAGTPKDLENMCSTWTPNSPFGSAFEQMTKSVSIKLQSNPKRRNDDDHLSFERATTGAQQLALASLLCRKLTIRFSAESDVGHNEAALNPKLILSDWRGLKIEALLSRAMFVNAGYGRVRHHRSTIEFLAYQQLKVMLDKGFPISEIKRILFAETPQGFRVLKPSLRPVTAWLALDVSWVFDEVLAREPVVLLMEGDPGSLTDEQKKQVLRAYTERPEDGKQRGSYFSLKEIKQLWSEGIIECVESLWAKGVEDWECRFLLLSLMKLHPQRSMSASMRELLFEQDAITSDRSSALSILIQLKDSCLDEVITSMQNESKIWPSKLLADAITQLYPKYLSAPVLSEFLGRLKSEEGDYFENETYWSRQISKDSWATSKVEELRDVLTTIIASTLKWCVQKYRMVTDRNDLLSPLLAACNRLMAEDGASYKTLYSSALAHRLFDRNSQDDPLKELRFNTVKLSKEGRESLFWIEADLVEKYFPVENDSNFQKIYFIKAGLISIDRTEDEGWILNNLRNTKDSTARRSYMLAASTRCLGPDSDERAGYLENLKTYVKDSTELSEQLCVILKPQPKNDTLEAHNKKSKLRDKERKLRQQENIDSWKQFWTELIQDPDRLLDDNHKDNARWNLWKSMRQSQSNAESAGWNRIFIEKHFNQQVANNLSENLQKLWREHKPTLPSERTPENGQILTKWEVGLSGISAESEDSSWATKISDTEAMLAARYALLEMNGFPLWIASLVRARPEATKQILCEELLYSINIVVPKNNYFQLLQSIEYTQDSVRKIFIPTILNWLSVNGERCKAEEDIETIKNRLSRLINIVLKDDSEETLNKLQDLALKYYASETNKDLHLVWLSPLISLNPELGLERLTEMLTGSQPEQHELAVSLFNNLFSKYDDARVVKTSIERFSPANLLSLIRLAYTYIKPAHDLKHVGIYSPSDRDDAEAVRSRLINSLMDSKGPAAWQAKLELIEDDLFGGFKNYLVVAARENEAVAIDQASLQESEVVELIKYGFAPPQNTGEMFQLIKDRLHDIEELLLTDESPREGWAKIDAENIMRRVISNELKHMSNGLYIVQQEKVTADEKRTDIRLQADNQQGIIELKLGERYSGRVLRNTIKEQLFERYMAPRDCHAGCLLITMNSDKKWVHPDTNEKLNRVGLQIMLEESAQKLMQEIGFEIKIAIFILDLTKRIK